MAGVPLTNPTGTGMQPINWLAAGLSGLGGAAGNVSGQSGTVTTKGTQTQDLSQNSQQSGTSRPLYDDTTLDYRNGLLDYLHNYLIKDPNLKGYQDQGLQQIGQDNTNAQMGLSQALAARGLNTSPVAANALTSANMNRINQQSTFSNSIPMLAEQLRQQRLNQVTSFFGGLPVGTQSDATASSDSSAKTTTDTTTEQKIKKSPWDIIGGLAGGLGGALSLMSPMKR